MSLSFEVLTLFPEAFAGFLESSIIARAQKNRLIDVRLSNFRNWTANKHKNVDDYPYGGFAGMVIQAQPVYEALGQILDDGNAPVIYFTPQGRPLNQRILESYSTYDRIVLLCGHYKELDQRARDLCVSDEISLGDYVLSGGELAAMVFIDGVSRLQPGALGDIDSARSDSFSQTGLGFPCYTRPEVFMELSVPDILRQGNHQEIAKWANEQAKCFTQSRRPDLTSKH